MRAKYIILITVLFGLGMIPVVTGNAFADQAKKRYLIVTDDTILSGMVEALLPEERYTAESILPSGQCPGHYDVKLSDIEKVQKAALVVSFRSMPFMEKTHSDGANRLVLDNDGRNWMAPDSYVFGINRLARELIRYFPGERNEIEVRKEATIRRIRGEARKLKEKMREAGISNGAVLASSMQKETLVWMGFRVVGVYGRPEAMSAREVTRLLKIGKDERAAAVVDNLQSGPDAGKSIAETLGKPHIVLSNFPSEKGYLATIIDNVNTVLTALEIK